MKPTTRNWLVSSEYDFEVAKSLFKNKHYIYSVFMCHLAVEKTLKAIVAESQDALPPKTHNLIRLSELGNLELPEEFRQFIAELNAVSIPTRYPEDFGSISKKFNKSHTRQVLNHSEKLLKWLRQNEKLSR